MDRIQLTIVLTLSLLAYTWIGYPALILSLGRIFRGRSLDLAIYPHVSLILAVHNEQGCIEEKLRDCIGLQYPHDRIEFLVASDHSTDDTEDIVVRLALRDTRSASFQPLGVQVRAEPKILRRSRRRERFSFSPMRTRGSLPTLCRKSSRILAIPSLVW